jgi:hypothetical protein
MYQLYINTVNLVQQRTETQYVLLFLFPLPFEPIEGDAFSSEFPHDAAGYYCLM